MATRKLRITDVACTMFVLNSAGLRNPPVATKVRRPLVATTSQCRFLVPRPLPSGEAPQEGGLSTKLMKMSAGPRQVSYD